MFPELEASELSELTPIVFNMELTQLGKEASNCQKWKLARQTDITVKNY